MDISILFFTSPYSLFVFQLSSTNDVWFFLFIYYLLLFLSLSLSLSIGYLSFSKIGDDSMAFFFLTNSMTLNMHY